MGTLTLQWNPQALLQDRTDRALKLAADDLGAALRKQFTSPVWAWPRQTLRRNGAVAGSPRDLVDTGALMNSQQKPERIKAGHYRIVWTEPYAAAVFLGAVFKKRRGSLPARNVAYGALQTFNLAESFARHWRQG